jgi:hypothetical protein
LVLSFFSLSLGRFFRLRKAIARILRGSTPWSSPLWEWTLDSVVGPSLEVDPTPWSSPLWGRWARLRGRPLSLEEEVGHHEPVGRSLIRYPSGPTSSSALVCLILSYSSP